jgi:hypothetical protein
VLAYCLPVEEMVHGATKALGAQLQLQLTKPYRLFAAQPRNRDLLGVKKIRQSGLLSFPVRTPYFADSHH